MIISTSINYHRAQVATSLSSLRLLSSYFGCLTFVPELRKLEIRIKVRMIHFFADYQFYVYLSTVPEPVKTSQIIALHVYLKGPITRKIFFRLNVSS